MKYTELKEKVKKIAESEIGEMGRCEQLEKDGNSLIHMENGKAEAGIIVNLLTIWCLSSLFSQFLPSFRLYFVKYIEKYSFTSHAMEKKKLYLSIELQIESSCSCVDQQIENRYAQKCGTARLREQRTSTETLYLLS